MLARRRAGSERFEAPARPSAGTMSVANVSIDYCDALGRRQLRAVEGVSFEARRNEFLCLIGPSGCGKSTLLKAMAGLERISAGEMVIDGQPVSGPGRERAMVFQSAGLLPWRSVLGNVSYGLELAGVPRRQREDKAGAMIDLVGLGGFEHSYPYQLSGGMQQRVNLARALVMDPSILLMDEPFAALDALTRERMQSELLRIWGGASVTVVFVTHQIDEAVLLGDRVVVLSPGPRSRVAEVIDVPVERPRSRASRQSPEFRSCVEQISALVYAREGSEAIGS